MKKVQQIFAKIKVLGSEEKIHHESKRHDMDKDGNKLFNVDVQEESLNEKYNIMEKTIVRYKSLEKLPKGDHVVQLKVTHMAEGNDKFLKVKSFFTILKSIDEKRTLKEIFS